MNFPWHNYYRSIVSGLLCIAQVWIRLKKNRWRVSSFKLQSFAVAKISYIYSSGRKNEPRKMWCPWLALAAWVLSWFYCRDDMEMRIQVVTFHHNSVVDSIHKSYTVLIHMIVPICSKFAQIATKTINLSLTQLCSIIWRVTKARIVQYQVLAGLLRQVIPLLEAAETSSWKITEIARISQPNQVNRVAVSVRDTDVQVFHQVHSV